MAVKVFKQRISELWLLLGLSAFVYVFGTIIFMVIMHFDKESTTFEIATLMEAIFATMIVALTGCFTFASNYNMAVGMGAVRKSYIPSYYLVNLIFVVIEYGVVVITHFIESAQINYLYPTVEKEAGVERFLFSQYTIPVLLLLSVIPLLAGCCILKFGKKAFWVLWVVYMSLCILPGRIEEALENNPNGKVANVINAVTEFFESVSVSSVNVAILLLTVGGLAVIWLMARKQRVTEM